MNSIPHYRDFGVAGELTHRPRGESARVRRGLLRGARLSLHPPVPPPPLGGLAGGSSPDRRP